MKLFSTATLLCFLSTATFSVTGQAYMSECGKNKCNGSYVFELGTIKTQINFNCKRDGYDVTCKATPEKLFTKEELAENTELSDSDIDKELEHLNSFEKKYTLTNRCSGKGIFACSGSDSAGLRRKKEMPQKYENFEYNYIRELDNLRNNANGENDRRAQAKALRDEKRKIAVNKLCKSRVVGTENSDEDPVDFEIVQNNRTTGRCIYEDGTTVDAYIGQDSIYDKDFIPRD